MSPDGSTKPSPEERLLKLIRGKPVGASSTQAHPAAAAGTPVLGSGGAAGSPPLRWPVFVGGGLAAVVVLELILLAAQTLRPVPPVEVPVIPPISSTVQPTQAPPPAVEVPSVAGSLTRPLFLSSIAASAAQSPTQGPQATAPSTTAKGLVARLTLMGIVAGDPPQAIIEDAETKKTYFVTTGQAVVEGAVLEQVLTNRVILSLNGEKITLSL